MVISLLAQAGTVDLATGNVQATSAGPDLSWWTAALIVTGLALLALAVTIVWWRVYTPPLERALLMLSIQSGLRKRDRDSLRILAQRGAAPHAVALVLSPSSLRGAIKATGDHDRSLSRERLKRLEQRLLG